MTAHRVVQLLRRVGVVGALISVAACGEEAITALDGGALSVRIVSGDGQTGPAGQELPMPLVVQVLEEKDKPISDVLVNFRVVLGGGSMFAGAGVTNKDGVAQDYWTLGPEPGENLVEVRAVDAATGEKLVFATFAATGACVSFCRFADEAAFLDASGALPAMTFPEPRGPTSTSYSEGGVTIGHAVGFVNEISDLTPVFEGNEFGVSGAENIDVQFAAAVYAFGLWMQDGFEVGEVRAPGVDSQFEFVFLSGETVVGTLTEDPPVDEAFFLGVVSTVPFDVVQIREVGSAIDDFGAPYFENDFVDLIYASTSPPVGLD